MRFYTHRFLFSLLLLRSSILGRGHNGHGDMLPRFFFKERLVALVDGSDIYRQTSGISPFNDCHSCHFTESQVLLGTVHVQWLMETGLKAWPLQPNMRQLWWDILASELCWACRCCLDLLCTWTLFLSNSWCLISSRCVYYKVPSHKTSVIKLSFKITSGEPTCLRDWCKDSRRQCWI